MKFANMALIAAGLLAASCGAEKEKKEAEAPFIGKHEVKVENGRMTPEVLWSFGRIGGATLSPDGKQLTYTVSYYSVEQNKSHTVIYVSDADGSNAKMLTTSTKSESSPTWIKKGSKIAFLASDENGKSQIFEMNADGTGRKQLSTNEKDVEGFLFSPDETKVLYIASVPYHHSIQKNDEDLPKASGMVITDLMYKHWDEYVTSIPKPYIAEFKDDKVGAGKDVLEGENYESPMKPFGGTEQFAWSPDSKKLAYTCRKKEGKAYAFSTDSDIYLYDLESGKTENLCKDYTDDKNMGYDTNPSFSPDGNYIAWQSMERDGYESDRNRLLVMDLKNHIKQYVTEWFDSGVDAFIWNTDSKSLYFSGVWHGTTHIYSADLEGNHKQITDGQYDYTVMQLQDGGKLLAERHSMMQSGELYSVDIQNGNVAQITQENKHIWDQLKVGNVEPRWTKTTDGKDMLSWVIYPVDFDKNKKYPTLLFCEGGPQSPVSQFWSYRWNFQIMAANDYIIIAPNRRGLPGFGQEWLEQISGDYGGQCMKDYLTAIDDICKESYVDKDRLGCVGASFGGFSVYWLAGNHDKRFKAFIAHDGIYNIEQQYVETEEMWFAEWDMKGAPWDKKNAAAQKTFATSPHKFVDKWDTPILCIQGEKDYRIMTNQGESAFNAAVIRGIPAELLLFPDENHWVLKPQNGVLWQRTFFRWLDKWLKN